MGEATTRGQSPRAPKKERARRAIVEAALRCFLVRGYEETSLEDLAAWLRVPPRRLQRAYGGKEGLALDWNDAVAARFREAVAARPRDQAVAQWWRAFVLSSAEDKEHRPLAREQHRLVQSVPSLHARRLALLRECEDLLTAAIAAEQPELGHVAARLAALALLGAWETAVDEWAYDPRERSLRELVAATLDALAAADAPRP